MFFDEYEPNNPLSAHKGLSKCSAIYLWIACLLLEFYSKLQNVFLFVLFNSLDKKILINKIIFSKAIEELKFLETEGINIIQQHKVYKIY